MAFSGFNVQLVLRIGLIILTSLALTWTIQLQGYWLLKVNLALLLALQGYLLFRFLNRWRRDLKTFAASVRQKDFSITFNTQAQNEAFRELYELLNDINQHVRQVESESAQQNQYFQHVVESAQVGLIAYDSALNVLLSNREALQMAGVGQLRNISHLQHLNTELYNSIIRLPLNQPRLITIKGSEIQKISARLSKIAIEGQEVFLLSLMNIRNELDENELQSWQDLINVLTHEIMNSITPINSMAGSMMKYLNRIEGNEEPVARATNSLQVISRRSNALMDFVNRYRTISDVPLARLQPVKIAELLDAVLVLLSEELTGIEVKRSFQDWVVQLDAALIEQVLINLLRNASYAVASRHEKLIEISVTGNEEKMVISVADNGVGIPEEIRDRIFIPFYTTRRNGSGIGLTLSKQIMHRHGGFIEVSSNEGKGTTFRLVFPSTGR